MLISLFKSRLVLYLKEPEFAESLEQGLYEKLKKGPLQKVWKTRKEIPRSQGKEGRNPTSTHQGEGKYCYILSSEMI